MPKHIFTLIFCLFIFTGSFAQKGGLIYYLKNSGKQVSTKDRADYSMVVLPPDTSIDKNLYVVYEYYPNGKIRLLTNSKTRDINLLYQGGYIAYYPNGKKKGMGSFKDGKPVGHEVNYFPNGKLYYTSNYGADGKVTYGECRDSTGKVLAENGNGSVLLLDEHFAGVIAEGKIDSGKEDGIWHLKKDDSIAVENEYNKGNLIYSKNIYKSGKIAFTKVDENPESTGGMDAFIRFLGHNIRYPLEAIKNGTQGKVIVSFICGTDGKLTDIYVAKGIGDGCDEEAIRVIKLFPSWKPGYVHGKPVNVAYSVPVSFSIN
ncbi:MAG: TonB family C-terminal protein [Mucilaginibacter sp.]|nr:TonB family C-terminal protein [Mucilaginibacter sp.]